MEQEIFEGLVVVELASVLAGPSVGLMFAELGAEVIKIENPKSGGDVTRGWKLASEKSDVSAYYASVNAGKKTVMKDVSKPADLNDVYRLLENADVVIVNFKTGAALKLGLDYGRVKSINPSIIYGEITGFNSDSKRLAYDVVLQAETGWMSINGQADGPATKMPVALMDVLAGHQLKQGVLAALWRRLKTGKGAKVSCSLESAGVASLFNQASNYLNVGQVPKRVGSKHPNIAPYGDVFVCKDEKEMVLAVGSDKQFQSLCAVCKRPEIAQDERWSTNASRVKNRGGLVETLASIFVAQDRLSWLNAFIANEVPAGAIRNLDEVLDHPDNAQLIVHDAHLNKRTTRSTVFQIE